MTGGKRGLLLAGHGSHLDANSSAPIFAHAARVRARGRYDEVKVAFWKEEPGLSRALDAFTAEDITVVPVFISSGYFTEEVLPRELGLATVGRTVRYAAPVGAHAALAEVIIQRAREAGAGPKDAVAVLGHGTPRNPNSEKNIYAQAERVRTSGAFAEVTTVFLDQEPSMHNVFEMTAATTIVAVPVFVADGWHVGTTIPADLALDGAELRRDGRTLRYARAVGTHELVCDVILALAAEAPLWTS